MPAALATAGLAAQPDPQPDRPGTPLPAGIREILYILWILADYARHLIGTLEQRAVARGFATIAQFFGTDALDTILAHLYRGLQRAIALEIVLRERAARGRDVAAQAPREPSRRKPSPAAVPAEALPSLTNLTDDSAAAMAARARRTEAKLARLMAANDPLALERLPLMNQLKAEVRRAPIGRTLARICCDLGISPKLCDAVFWNRLFPAIHFHRGSLSGYLMEIRRREMQFEKEDWKHPDLEWPEETREGTRRVLGFFIGEQPVDPWQTVPEPAAPAATAPGDAPIAPAATAPDDPQVRSDATAPADPSVVAAATRPP